jgi:hypothetical protein
MNATELITNSVYQSPSQGPDTHSAGLENPLFYGT